MDSRLMKQVLEMAVQSEQHSGQQVLNAQSEISKYEAKQKEFELYRQEYESRIKSVGSGGLSSDYLTEYERFKGALDNVIDQHAELADNSHKNAEVLKSRWGLSRQRKRALQQLVNTNELTAKRDISRREQSQIEETLSRLHSPGY